MNLVFNKYSDWIFQYFADCSDENGEVFYFDIFNCCERQFLDFDVGHFEQTYSYMVKKNIISITVRFAQFNGSVIVIGKMDPMHMMKHACKKELLS